MTSPNKQGFHCSGDHVFIEVPNYQQANKPMSLQNPQLYSPVLQPKGALAVRLKCGLGAKTNVPHASDRVLQMSVWGGC
jgi:hypothetical protein